MAVSRTIRYFGKTKSELHPAPLRSKAKVAKVGRDGRKTQEAYDLLELVESRCDGGSIIFCTQYEPSGWYSRINPESSNENPISDAIMDRIIHNSYEVRIEGRISMRERRGIKSSTKGAAHE